MMLPRSAARIASPKTIAGTWTPPTRFMSMTSRHTDMGVGQTLCRPIVASFGVVAAGRVVEHGRLANLVADRLEGAQH